jgi:N-acetylglucosamine kinase-like BadF-type ATPase
MKPEEVLAFDLGQSGSRFKQGELLITTQRGKLAGEDLFVSLRTIFELTQNLSAEYMALSCSGFNGIVSEPEKFGELCKEFFGATKVAIIDDGLAGYIGSLNGREGVALSIGGGVVAVGGNDGTYAHRDGLGSVFGDEGGGYWLGKLAMTKALGLRQGRGDDDQMLQYFKEDCAAYDLLTMIDGPDASTFAIRTAKKVLDAADAGVSTATAIVDEGAFLLAQTVVATWLGAGGKRSDSPEIVVKGGPAANASYVAKIQMEIRNRIPEAQFVQSAGDNLDGATWIAEHMRRDAPPLLLWSGL